MSGIQGKEIRPDKVAIYIRWSTEEQTDGTTLAEQKEGCEFFVKSQGWFVNPSLTFIDDGYSGASLDRPGMRQLRELVQTNEVDCVVVLKIDRLSRNIVDATQLVLQEWKDKCHLRCVRQPIDSTSETGRMFFSILATFADFERAQISERTYQGRLRRIKEGKAAFTVPYGYLAGENPGERLLDPVAAPIVAELFRRAREESAGPGVLVTWLQGQGVTPPRGGVWNVVTVRRMLRNPIYAGRIVYGTSATIKKAGNRYPSRQKRAEPLVVTEASALPAIITPEVFEDVQAIMEQRTEFHSKHRRAGASVHLLTGIAKCKCGASINCHWASGKRHYWCSRRIVYGANGCPADGGLMLAEHVDQVVVKDLLATFQAKHRAAAAEAAQSHSSQEVLALEAELGRLNSEVSKLDKRLSDLRAAAGVGEISLEEWRDLRGALEPRRKDLVEQASSVEAKLKRATAGMSADRVLIQRMEQLDRWSDLSIAEQKELIRDLAEEIELYKPRGRNRKYEISLTWRFADPAQ